MKKIALILVVLLLTSGVYAQDKLRAYVTDNAKVLPPAEVDQLTSLIQSLEKSTTVEIAIVTVPTLEGTTIEEYAVEAFEKSGIGKKDVDNGLLIVLAPNDRQYRIEVGYGLEGVLPDITARQIGVKVMEPYFKEGINGQGLIAGVQTMAQYIEGNPEVVSKYRSSQVQPEKIKLYAIIAFILFFIVFSSLSRRHNSMVFVPGFGGGMRGPRLGGGFSGGFGGFGGGMSGGGGFSGRF